MGLNDFENPTPARVLTWGVVGTVVLFGVICGLGAVVQVAGISLNRVAVENSQQYAETNTEAFYTRLETVRKIESDLAGLPEGDPQIEPLQNQKALLENEMRREVAKIPVDARTPDMALYGGVR